MVRMTLPFAPVRPYQNVILVDPAGCSTGGTGVMVGAGALVAAGAPALVGAAAAGALVASALAAVGAAAAVAGGLAAAVAAAGGFAAVGAVVLGAGLPPHAASSAATRLTNRSRLIFLKVWHSSHRKESCIVASRSRRRYRAPLGHDVPSLS